MACSRSCAVLAILAVTVLALATTANAAVMTSSSTAPTVDGADIASFGTPTTTGWPTEDKWWPGSATAFGSPGKTIGQTFTTGSEDVVLNAFTFQIKYATEPTKEYAIRVGTVSGSTFTEIASESATQSAATADDAYWTWTLDSPVSLSANTLYGVDVGLLSSTSAWQTGIPYVYRTADVYPGGTRFRSGSAGYGVGDSSMSDMSADRVFHLDMEPAGGPGPGPVDIPIVNGSFELPPRRDGGYGPATGWDPWGPGADVGNWNPEAYQFSTGAPDGEHVGWAYQYAPLTGTPNGLTQVLDTNFEASTDYSLSVEIGNAWDYYFSGYAVQLLAGGVVIAEDYDTLHPPWEEWATSLVNYTYDPAHAGLVGLPLEIRLLSLGTDPEGGGEDVEVEFDHVRLTATPAAADVIPEPASLSLLGLGALLALRRRRRSR